MQSACRRADRIFSLSSGVTREAKSSGNSKSSVPAQLWPVPLLSAWAGGVCLVNWELLLSQQEKGNIRNFWKKLQLLSLYPAFYKWVQLYLILLVKSVWLRLPSVQGSCGTWSDERKIFWFRELQNSIKISACAIFGLAMAKNEKLISDFFKLFVL